MYLWIKSLGASGAILGLAILALYLTPMGQLKEEACSERNAGKSSALQYHLLPDVWETRTVGQFKFRTFSSLDFKNLISCEQLTSSPKLPQGLTLVLATKAKHELSSIVKKELDSTGLAYVEFSEADGILNTPLERLPTIAITDGEWKVSICPFTDRNFINSWVEEEIEKFE